MHVCFYANTTHSYTILVTVVSYYSHLLWWLQFDFEQHFNPDSQKEYHLYLDYTKCVDVNVQISISTFEYSHNFAILSEP